MKYFSPAKKLLLGVLTIFVTFIFIIVVINSSIFDEELSPQVAETLKTIKMPANNKNAFFAIWGLSATSEKNVIETGKALIARYRENRDKRGIDEITNEDYVEILGGENLDASWEDDYERCNARREYGCTMKLTSQLDNKPIKDPRLLLMLERYEQITKMSNYQHIDHLTFASPLPPYDILMKLRGLKLANALGSENSYGLIQQLSQDLVFWRMMLEKGDTLIDKMVAIAGIWSDTQVISEYLVNQSTLAVDDLQMLNTLLEPLSQQELAISEAFKFEQQSFYNTLNSSNREQLEQAFGMVSKPLYWLIQKNATINDYQQYFVQPINQMNSLSTRDFYKAYNDKSTCCFKELERLVNFSPSSLYNIGGKILLSESLFGAQDYIARVHDLNGVISLVRLQLQLMGLPDDTLGDLINRSKITNPYTGEPMTYDKKNNWLGFECLNEGSLCKIEL